MREADPFILDPESAAAQQESIVPRLVGEYLRSQHGRPKPKAPEFLACDQQRQMWLIRWPSGNLKWETEVSLLARRIGIPRQPLIGVYDNS